MKLRLVMNPGSRSRRGQNLWRVWRHLLESAGCHLECCTTESPDHAIELARNSPDVDAVVAVGGDGTINAVLDGILQSGRRDLPMGVLYSGTSPDFCRFHGIPLDPESAVRALLSGRGRQVDAVRISYSQPDGTPLTAHFGCGSNIGLGGMIARRANRFRRFLGDRLGTGLAAVMTLIRTSAVDLSLEAEGNVHDVHACNNISILKSPFIASGLKLDLELLPDDGNLCVVAVSGKSPLGMLNLLPGFYSGQAVHDPAVQIWRCRSLTVRGPVTTEVEFDGDPRGFLPVTIEILPRSLSLLGCT